MSHMRGIWAEMRVPACWVCFCAASSFLAKLYQRCVTELGDNGKALVRYIDNGSTRYDGKECAESLSKLHREKSATGPLEAGEMVTRRSHKFGQQSW